LACWLLSKPTECRLRGEQKSERWTKHVCRYLSADPLIKAQSLSPVATARGALFQELRAISTSDHCERVVPMVCARLDRANRASVFGRYWRIHRQTLAVDGASATGRQRPWVELPKAR
jgi:hypothetical protein